MDQSTGIHDGLRTDLFLFVREAVIPRFHAILQGGFFVKVLVGTSMGELLRDQLGVAPEIMERISTVFLDGKPVDDIDAAMTKEGSTLALSSAMPGLVGATMRRHGFYASFRSSITHEPEGRKGEEKDGILRVKIFNLLLADLGPLFLNRGVYVPSEELKGFLESQSDGFFDGVIEAVLDRRQIPPSSIMTGVRGGDGWARLRVCASQ